MRVWQINDAGASKVTLRQGPYDLPPLCDALSPDARWLVLSSLEKNKEGFRQHVELVVVNLVGPAKPKLVAVDEASLEALRWTSDALEFEAKHDPWDEGSAPRRCFRLDLATQVVSEVDAWPDASAFHRSPDGRREARRGTRTPHDLTADRTLEARRVGAADSTSRFAFPRSLGPFMWAGSKHLLLEGETLLDLDTGTLTSLAFDGAPCAFNDDATLAFVRRGNVLGVATLAW